MACLISNLCSSFMPVYVYDCSSVQYQFTRDVSAKSHELFKGTCHALGVTPQVSPSLVITGNHCGKTKTGKVVV